MIFRNRRDSAGADQGEPDADFSESEAEGGSGVESILSERVESILEEAEQAAAGIRYDAEQEASRYLDESRYRADEIAALRIREISDLTDALVNRVRAVAQQSDELIAALDDAGGRAAGGTPDAGLPAQPAAAAPGPPPYAAAPPAPVPQPPQQPQYPPVPSAPAQPYSQHDQQAYEQPYQQPAPAPAAAPFEPAPPAAPPPGMLPTLPERPPQTAAPPPPAPAPYPPAPPDREPEPPHLPGPPPPPTAEMAPATEASEGGEPARLLATQMAVAGSGRDEISQRLRDEYGIQDPSAILAELGI